MPKFIKGFFSCYETFLNRSSSDKPLVIKDYLNLLLLVLLMAVVFVFVGFISVNLENFYYIFFCLNTLAVFAFTVYRIKKINLAKKDKTLTPIWIPVLVEALHFLAILMLFQSLVLMVYFRFIVSSLFIAFIFLISAFSTAITFYIRKQVARKDVNILNVSLWLFVIYFALEHIFPLSSFVLSNALITTFVMFIFVYKYLLNVYTEKESSDWFSSNLIFTIISLLVILYFVAQSRLNNPEVLSHQLTRSIAILFIVFCLHIQITFPKFKRGEM